MASKKVGCSGGNVAGYLAFDWAAPKGGRSAVSMDYNWVRLLVDYSAFRKDCVLAETMAELRENISAGC